MNLWRMLFLGSLLLSTACTSLGGEVAPWADESRGIRNNNPGNIVKTAIKWQGKVECDDKRFECFRDARFGIRAMFKNLDSYRTRHKIDTLSAIVDRWESGTGSASSGYIKFMESCTVLEGTTVIDTRDRKIRVVDCLIRFENGSNPYGRLVEEVYDDTYGGLYAARLSSDGWRYENVGYEVGAEEAGSPDTVASSGPAERGSGQGTASGRTELSVYTPNDSDNYDIRSLCSTAGGYDNRPNDSCMVWLDGGQVRVLVLHRPIGGSEVASDEWGIGADPAAYARDNGSARLVLWLLAGLILGPSLAYLILEKFYYPRVYPLLYNNRRDK